MVPNHLRSALSVIATLSLPYWRGRLYPAMITHSVHVTGQDAAPGNDSAAYVGMYAYGKLNDDLGGLVPFHTCAFFGNPSNYENTTFECVVNLY